jgi:hypothetical protein
VSVCASCYGIMTGNKWKLSLLIYPFGRRGNMTSKVEASCMWNILSEKLYTRLRKETAKIHTDSLLHAHFHCMLMKMLPGKWRDECLVI